MPGSDGERPSDAELLRRHVAGDSEAFGELFRRHRDRLWAVALRTVCDPDEAADALQDAMVSAFRRAADFRGESAVTTLFDVDDPRVAARSGEFGGVVPVGGDVVEVLGAHSD